MKSGRGAVAILGFVALAAAGPAAAQDRGIYLGGSFGYSQFKEACERALVPCDDHDAAWRLFAGYQFSRYIGAEVGFADLGAASGSGPAGNFKLGVNGWDLSAVGSIALPAGLSGLVRFGVYRMRTTLDQEGAFGSLHDAGTNSGPTYGAGLGYTLWKLGLRAEWQRYQNVGSGSTGKDDVDVFSVGALFRF